MGTEYDKIHPYTIVISYDAEAIDVSITRKKREFSGKEVVLFIALYFLILWLFRLIILQIVDLVTNSSGFVSNFLLIMVYGDPLSSFSGWHL